MCVFFFHLSLILSAYQFTLSERTTIDNNQNDHKRAVKKAKPDDCKSLVDDFKKMSYTTAETGRVKSIKSKFENLNSLESLDISAAVPHKYRKPSPSFLFKRSSTSIDLPIHRSIANATSSSNNNNNNKFKRISPPKQPPPPRPTSSASSIIEPNHKSISNANAKQTENTTKSPSFGYLRRHNNLDRTVSADAFLIKKRNFIANDEDTLKPLKEIKENVEVRLMRHTNDPINGVALNGVQHFVLVTKLTVTIVIVRKMVITAMAIQKVLMALRRRRQKVQSSQIERQQRMQQLRHRRRRQTMMCQSFRRNLRKNLKIY